MLVEYNPVFSKFLEITPDELSSVESLVTEDQEKLIFGNKIYTGLLDYIRDKVDFEISGLSSYDFVGRFKEVDAIDKELKTKTLRDYQIKTVYKSLIKTRGIIQVATGGGKTIVAISIIKHLQVLGFKKVTYIVPTGYLMQQTYNILKIEGEFDSISCVGYGSKYKEADIQVCVANSAYNAIKKEKQLAEHIRESDIYIVDEAHRSPAKTWVTISETCNADYRYALTATAFEDPTTNVRSIRDLRFIGLIGTPIVYIPSKVLVSKGYLASPVVTMLHTDSGALHWIWSPRFAYKKGIVQNLKRNSIIVSLMNSIYSGNHKMLTFIIQLDHGRKLAKLATKCGVETLFVSGGGNVELFKVSGRVSNKKWDMVRIAQYVEENDAVNIVASSAFDEGVDLPEIDVVIMAASMKRYRRYVQRSGRGMREKEKLNKLFVFDFYDTQNRILENYSKARMGVYKNEEFDFSDSLEQVGNELGVVIDINRELRL